MTDVMRSMALMLILLTPFVLYGWALAYSLSPKQQKRRRADRARSRAYRDKILLDPILKGTMAHKFAELNLAVESLGWAIRNATIGRWLK